MKASDNQFPKLILAESAAPGTPSSGLGYIYASTDGTAYFVNDAGASTALGGGGGGGDVATDAIWDAAGDLAVGSGSNTASRLAIGNAGGVLARINGAVAWNAGTAFPTAATGDRYWRTDRNIEYYYDGTRWLSSTLYAQSASLGDAVTPIVNTNTNAGRWAVWSDDYDVYLVAMHWTSLVNTTNSGSAYWIATLAKVDGSSASTIVTANTSADSANVYVTHKTTIGALLGTANDVVKLDMSKTGSPGSIYVHAMITYRLVG